MYDPNEIASYERLANAIVSRAARDYSLALKAQKRNPENINVMRIISDCERFFRSEYYRILTDIDGEWLMERIRKNAENERKKP